ncbi:hypothetical protein G9F72_025075 [Clostridium estertheticum]|uniref:hypothetical protein n=1 Tax=Clostridium estertheticum TaxID=238834 RepID=UPI0013E91A42|nr:hypothetical protein [Clostridium estertheticum]MBZ9689552.1 hypothetical protein [Clostridium estertheticum]
MYSTKSLTIPKSSLGGIFMKLSFFKNRKTQYTYWAKPLFSNTFKCISDLDYFLITSRHI